MVLHRADFKVETLRRQYVRAGLGIKLDEALRVRRCCILFSPINVRMSLRNIDATPKSDLIIVDEVLKPKIRAIVVHGSMSHLLSYS